MSRDIGKTGVIGLLLWGLLHAWFGHDLFHGHHHSHHQDPAQAAHTTAVHRPDSGPVAKLAPVALLVTLCDFALPPVPQVAEEGIDFDVIDTIEPQFLERPQSQRAPPLPFSFA